jgi:serine/threonine-protein kinase
MAGKPEQACPKLEESQRLDPATGTLMALALCQEQQGKLASAWAAFADVEGRSRLDGRADRERTAREHGAALRPRLSTLTLQIAAEASGAATGLAISIDGVAIGRGAWSSAIPVDGGQHVVEAAAPGKKSWRATVTVEREGDHVRVDVPALPPMRDATATPTVTPAAPAAPPVDDATPTPTLTATGDLGAGARDEAPAAGSGWRTAGFSLMGVGALALAAGVYLGLDAKRSYDAARADCNGDGCVRGPYARAQDARTEGNWATLVSVAGGVAAAAGAALWLWAPRAPERTALSSLPRIERLGVHPGGVTLAGRF